VNKAEQQTFLSTNIGYFWSLFSLSIIGLPNIERTICFYKGQYWTSRGTIEKVDKNMYFSVYQVLNLGLLPSGVTLFAGFCHRPFYP